MRVLVVSQVPPWPAIGGGFHRVGSQLRALARAGAQVDLLLIRADAPEFVAFDSVRLVADVTLPGVRASRNPARRLLRALTSSKPLNVNPAIPTAVVEAAATLPLDDYDLHWVFRAEFADAWPACSVPLVVDLDDIESKKIQSGSAVLSKQVSRFHRVIKKFNDSRNAANWARMQFRVVRRASAHLVCAEGDLSAIGPATAFVVPNAIVTSSADDAQKEEAPIIRRSDASVLFHGKLTYPPNADAATWLVREIAPIVWTMEPAVRFQFAGKASPDLVASLSGDARVEFLGFVPDMREVVAQAPLVVAPIRFGGGTRLKLIEAAATGSPMLSTTIGAEGLPFTPGENIMIADDARGFAETITRLLGDQATRDRLGTAARTLYLSDMSQRAVDSAVQRVIESLARS